MLSTEERANFNRFAVKLAAREPELALELLNLVEAHAYPRIYESRKFQDTKRAFKLAEGPVTSKKPWTLRDLRLSGHDALASHLGRQGIIDSEKLSEHRWEEVLNWPGFGKAKLTALRTVCDAE